VQEWFKAQTKINYSYEIRKIEGRWIKGIEKQGDYKENLYMSNY